MLLGRIRTAGAYDDGIEEDINEDDSWQRDTYDDDGYQVDADTGVESDNVYGRGDDQSPMYVSDIGRTDSSIHNGGLNTQVNDAGFAIREDQRIKSGDDDYLVLDEESSVEEGQESGNECAAVNDMVSRNKLVMRSSGEEIERSSTEHGYDAESRGLGVVGSANQDRLVMRPSADTVNRREQGYFSQSDLASGVVEETQDSSSSQVEGSDADGIEQISDVERSLQEWLSRSMTESNVDGSTVDKAGGLRSTGGNGIVGEVNHQNDVGYNEREGIKEAAPIESSKLGGARTVMPSTSGRNPKDQTSSETSVETMSVPTASIPSAVGDNEELLGKRESVQQVVGGTGSGGLESGVSYAQNADEASQLKGGRRSGKATQNLVDSKEWSDKTRISGDTIAVPNSPSTNDIHSSTGISQSGQADTLGSWHVEDKKDGVRSTRRDLGGGDASPLSDTDIGEGQRPGRFTNVRTGIEAQAEEAQRGVDVIENAVTKLSERMEKLDIAITRLGQQDDSREDVHTLIRMLSDDLRSVTERLDEMEKQISIMARKSSDTMGYAMRGKFHCKSCGAHGYVVSTIRCSRCGDESWWGWWPEEDGQ